MDKEEIKKIREKFGLNQTKFAKKLGISRQTLSRYERGERKIQLNTEKLARELEDKFDYVNKNNNFNNKK